MPRSELVRVVCADRSIRIEKASAVRAEA